MQKTIRNAWLLVGILVALVATQAMAQQVIRVHTQSQTVFSDGETTQNTNLQIRQSDEGFEVSVKKKGEDGELVQFEKVYSTYGEWKNDEVFQAFCEKVGLDLDETDHAASSILFSTNGEFDYVGSVRIKVQEADEIGEAEDDLIIEVGEGAEKVITYDFSKDLTDAEVTVSGDEIKVSDRIFIILRHDTEEREVIEEEIDTHELFEKADLQNGKPLDEGSLSIFPNPTAGAFTVRLSNENLDPLKVRIVDLNGREVWNQTYDKNATNLEAKIDLSGLETGFFILQASQGDRVSTRKIIVE